MTDALKNLLHELHEAIVVDGLRQLDNAEMTLAFFGLATRQTCLVSIADAHTWIIKTTHRRSPIAVKLRIGQFNNSPAVLHKQTDIRSPLCLEG
jgi:hypothetical protein